MRIIFCRNCFPEDIIADFEVLNKPTEAQCKAIEKEVDMAIESYGSENNGDYEGIDLYEICRNAVKKHLKLSRRRIVETFTFYI